MTTRRYRRTGLPFLALVVATNCVFWIEFLSGRISPLPLTSLGEVFGPLGVCLLGALVTIGGWFYGRRRAIPADHRIHRPRDVGFQLAILAAAVNLALAGLMHWTGANGAGSLHTKIIVILIWPLLSLPTQVMAAYCKGRASDRPEGERERDSPAA